MLDRKESNFQKPLRSIPYTTNVYFKCLQRQNGMCTHKPTQKTNTTNVPLLWVQEKGLRITDRVDEVARFVFMTDMVNEEEHITRNYLLNYLLVGSLGSNPNLPSNR